jgi:hypothetical protein
VPWVSRPDDGTTDAIVGPERLVLRTPAALYGDDPKTVGEFTVEAGQSVPFVLKLGDVMDDLMGRDTSSCERSATPNVPYPPPVQRPPLLAMVQRLDSRSISEW